MTNAKHSWGGGRRGEGGEGGQLLRFLSRGVGWELRSGVFCRLVPLIRPQPLSPNPSSEQNPILNWPLVSSEWILIAVAYIIHYDSFRFLFHSLIPS